ncbi:MAG TPA: Ppx/GppA family phosphatase, partial [Sphingopyxis sp.]|nr:Ppx/GppA family phosphatase [Sphingopyxis sp.]
LTGGIQAPLGGSSIALADGKLRLSVAPEWHHLMGEAVDRRLRALGNALDAEPVIDLLGGGAA